MSNIDMISAAEAVSALKQYEAALRKRLNRIEEGMRKGPYPGNVEEMFRYSRTMVSAEMDWISEYVSSLEQQEK
jgi:hypothetical protein